MPHTDRPRAVELTLVYTAYSAPDDFGYICAGVYGNYKYRGDHKIESSSARRERIAPIDDHCLNHHRSSAEYLDIRRQQEIDDFLQHPNTFLFRLRYGSDYAYQKTYQKSEQRRNQRYEKSIPYTFEKIFIICFKHVADRFKETFVGVVFLPDDVHGCGFFGDVTVDSARVQCHKHIRKRRETVDDGKLSRLSL